MWIQDSCSMLILLLNTGYSLWKAIHDLYMLLVIVFYVNACIFLIFRLLMIQKRPAVFVTEKTIMANLKISIITCYVRWMLNVYFFEKSQMYLKIEEDSWHNNIFLFLHNLDILSSCGKYYEWISLFCKLDFYHYGTHCIHRLVSLTAEPFQHKRDVYSRLEVNFPSSTHPHVMLKLATRR